MKAVLLSVRPKWCEKILSGEKRIEVRKSAPKEASFKCYIYCTKNGEEFVVKSDKYLAPSKLQKGKVIGEFICNKVELFTVGSLRCDNIQELACLSYREIINYYYKPEELDGKTSKIGYGWHINDLTLYDKPKELSEFCIPCKVSCENCKNPLYFECWCEEKGKKIVTRPPQSWCYVEDLGEEK